MSFIINRSDLEKDHKDFIRQECNITKKQSRYLPISDVPETITIFTADKQGNISIPFALWKDLLDEFPNEDHYDEVNVKFRVEPLETKDRDQKTVLTQVIQKLKNDHFAFLALRTGFGKTYLGLRLIVELKVKAVILCHSSTLHKQWQDEAKKYCPDLNFQVVGTKKINENADVYIMGIQKSTHYDKDVFRRVGLVIVDEAHLTYTQTFTDALLQFNPKYLIGLSATPDRQDGMHTLLHPFFGPKKDFIVRRQTKKMTVIKYKTAFKPEVTYDWNGVVNWNTLVNSLAYNEERHMLVIKIVKDIYDNKENSDKKILILCKRVDTVLSLTKLFNSNKVTTDYVTASKKKFDNDAKILIGTVGKLSVGFDSDRHILILESDQKDVRQSEGRIRADDSLIIDIVDDHGILESHWKERAKWYLQRGAEIKIGGVKNTKEESSTEESTTTKKHKRLLPSNKN